jgi:hypothetical protein
VQFRIITDGNTDPSPKVGTSAVITIAPEPDAQVVQLQVQAVLGDKFSSPSDKVPVSIPPAPVESTTTVPATSTTVAATAATTTQGGATVPVIVGPGGAGPSTGDTTTSTAVTTDGSTSTSSTVPVGAVVDDLKNRKPTWVAMLGSAAPASQTGGTTLDDRKQQLSDQFGIPVDQLGDFSVRDTVALSPDGTPSGLFQSAPPQSRFIYVEKPTKEDAEAVCGAVKPCFVLQLIGAARRSESKPIAIVSSKASNTSTAALDKTIADLKAKLGGNDVYAFDASAYPQFKLKDTVLLFVPGFASTADATAFCTQFKDIVQSCRTETLQPSN